MSVSESYLASVVLKIDVCDTVSNWKSRDKYCGDASTEKTWDISLNAFALLSQDVAYKVVYVKYSGVNEFGRSLGSNFNLCINYSFLI